MDIYIYPHYVLCMCVYLTIFAHEYHCLFAAWLCGNSRSIQAKMGQSGQSSGQTNCMCVCVCVYEKKNKPMKIVFFSMGKHKHKENKLKNININNNKNTGEK